MRPNLPYRPAPSLEAVVEHWLGIILPWYLILVLVVTIVGALVGYLAHDPFNVGDWLINYSGGMIRRGLTGEVACTLSRLTGVDPGLVVVSLQTLAYALFFLFSYLLLRGQRLLPYALAILSPYIFTFQINSIEGGYRKEVLLFAVLAFATWTRLRLAPATFEKVFLFVVLACFPALVLSHEGLIVFLPYLLLLYSPATMPQWRRFWVLVGLCIPSVVALAACLLFKGSLSQEHAIFRSLSELGYPVDGGAITFLHRSVADNVAQMLDYAPRNGFLGYIPATALALVAFVPLFPSLADLLRNPWARLMVAASVFASIALAVIAIDWGRWVYINLVALFLVSTIAAQTRAPLPSMQTDAPAIAHSGNRPLNYLIIALAAVWMTFFHLPHASGSVRLIIAPYASATNPFNFIRPITELRRLLGQNNDRGR